MASKLKEIISVQKAIEIYLNKVNLYIVTMRSTFSVENLLEAWHQKRIKKDGIVGEFEFSFHGFGCTFTDENGWVFNIDLCSCFPIDISDVNPWNIWIFLQSTGKSVFDFDEYELFEVEFEHHLKTCDPRKTIS